LLKTAEGGKRRSSGFVERRARLGTEQGDEAAIVEPDGMPPIWLDLDHLVREAAKSRHEPHQPPGKAALRHIGLIIEQQSQPR
jgi:hypothetical protein